jgi:2-C-methyl-D-erythritol 2,4-cyclodiphosphate synthase
MSIRVGIGYDSHRLVAGERLVIGGVEIGFDRGLAGHSDADVLAHAVTDAILGAAGAGDIGTHFPPDDERWRDADSIELLGTVVAGLDGRVVNVDATVICEQPAIGPHREAVESRLGAAIGAPASVKATTNEGMGAIGRGEGIAVIAVAAFEPAGGRDRESGSE